MTVRWAMVERSARASSPPVERLNPGRGNEFQLGNPIVPGFDGRCRASQVYCSPPSGESSMFISSSKGNNQGNVIKKAKQIRGKASSIAPACFYLANEQKLQCALVRTDVKKDGIGRCPWQRSTWEGRMTRRTNEVVCREAGRTDRSHLSQK